MQVVNPYLEAGRNCGFHIFPFLRVNLIHFQSLEYSIVELNPKCTYGFIQNTLVNNHSIHKGSQWVVLNATVPFKWRSNVRNTRCIRWIIYRNTNGRIKTHPVDTETLNRMSWNFSNDSFFSIT